MRWRNNVLYASRRRYVFKHRIHNCGRVGAATVVVFARRIVFIEENGDILKYPTKKIRTSGFTHTGVVYSEGLDSSLLHLPHPYGNLQCLKLVDHPFVIIPSSKERICLFYRVAHTGKQYVEIHRGAWPRLHSQMRAEVLYSVQAMALHHRRLLFLANSVLHICALSRALPGAPARTDTSASLHPAGIVSDAGQGPEAAGDRTGKQRSMKMLSISAHSEYPVACRHVHSISPFNTKSGVVTLVNGCHVIDEQGVVLRMCCENEGAAKHQLTETGRRYARAIRRKGAGRYAPLPFAYQTKGEQLVSRCLPPEKNGIYLRSRLENPDVPTEALLVKCVYALNLDELEFLCRSLEVSVQMIRSPRTFRSEVFDALVCRLLVTHPRFAYLFSLLSLHTRIPDVHTYALIRYREKLVEKSKNAGYAMIREDRRAQTAQPKQGVDLSIAPSLEDFEHVERMPERMKNANSIAECKELLSGKTVADFGFNEYDTENRRRKAFITGMLASVGRGVFLLNRNVQANILHVPYLKVHLKKSNNVVSLYPLTDWEKLWPSFHNAVAVALSIPNRPFVSTTHLDKITPQALLGLAGAIFGLGVKESICPNKLSLGERMILARSLLITLSRSYESLLIAATILGNAFILRGTGERKLANILWYNLKSKEATSVLLMWSVLALGILNARRNDLFAKQILVSYMQRRGVISQTGAVIGGEVHKKTSYYDKFHRLASAFAISYICAGCHIKEYMRLPDRTCEIFVNGVTYMYTGLEKIAILLDEKPANSLPVNRFYSELFKVLVRNDAGYKDTFAAAYASPHTLEEAHALAGKILGLAILRIPEEGERADEFFVSDITMLVYTLERQKSVPHVLMDYVLLGACLVLNSTGDLRILSACRRLLEVTEHVEQLNEIVDYSVCAREYIVQFGARFGRKQHVKMCLSLLAPSCGSMRVDKSPMSIAFLLTSFYVEQPITPEDQDAFQVVRHFYLLCLVAVGDRHEEKRPGCSPSEKLRQTLASLPPEDAKVALDVLCSYFESNPSAALDPDAIEETIEETYGRFGSQPMGCFE